jgi:HK97 family phage portal protein
MQQMQFYTNMARPGIMLTTDMQFGTEQLAELRRLWEEQTTGVNAGRTPILTAGLKPFIVQPGTAKDAELAEIFKMSQQNIALAFRIPLQMLGITSGGAGGGSAAPTTELIQSWLAGSLGFALNHVEEAFGKTFGLYGQPDEYVEFSTATLLRSNLKDRIDALVRGVQGGVYSPNEARAQEELPAVEFGDEPRVQQQVVPLSAAEGIPTTPGSPAAPPALPAPAPEPKMLELFDDAASIRSRFRASHVRHSI